MSSRTPTVRPVSWLAMIPQFAILAVVVAIGAFLGSTNFVIWACLAYIVYSQGSRRLIARAHRAGMSLVKQQRFEEAIPKFLNSLEFFDRHSWIDRYRSIVLLSAAAMSYREMALLNTAFCYAQIGEGQRARDYYNQCLEEFPDNGIATAALRLMDSAIQASVVAAH